MSFDPALLPDTFLGPIAQPLSGRQLSGAMLPNTSDGFISNPLTTPHDTWGAITIPVGASGPAFVPVASTQPIAAGDPTLSIILDFIKAFVVSDKNATVAWQAIFSTAPPIASTFPHDPSEVVFNTKYLPALFLWRDSGREEYIAEDWLHQVWVLKALWVYPLAAQNNQRARQPFANAIVKSIATALQRNRTPSWLQASDTDPNAPATGSLIDDIANIEKLELQTWRRSSLVIPAADGTAKDTYPAIELTIELRENLEYGLDRFDSLNEPGPLNRSTLTIRNEAGVVVEDGRL